MLRHVYFPGISEICYLPWIELSLPSLSGLYELFMGKALGKVSNTYIALHYACLNHILQPLK